LMSEINVTPFVDVMLVLLIIFMVTAPLMRSGVDIDLPKEDAGPSEVRQENVVQLTGDGRIVFNENQVSEKQLADEMKKLSLLPRAEVFLEADRRLPYEKVVEIMGVIKRAGVERLGLVTDMPIRKKG